MTKQREYFLLGCLIFIALLLRVYLAGRFYCQSTDEFCNIFLTRSTLESGFRNYPHLFMWLYYFLSAVILFFLKDAFVAIRVVPIVSGALTLGLVYFLAKRLFGNKVAWLAFFLLFINPEFTLIGSLPLSESLYTFFMVFSVYLCVNKRIFFGAASVGLSFLTRMEGLLVGMPYYLFSVSVSHVKRKAFKVSTVLALFILFTLFMNLWVRKPFLYLTETFRNQGLEDPETVTFVYAGFLSVLARSGSAIVTFGKYLIDLFSYNVIFALAGLGFLLSRKNIVRDETRVFVACFIAHFLFWFAFIFYFKKIPYDYHRYLYPLIPLGAIACAYGYFRLHKAWRWRYLLLFFFILNIVLGYRTYYHNVGKKYFEWNAYSREMMKATPWIESTIRTDANNRILIDGIPYFYSFRFSSPSNRVMWAQLYNKTQGAFTIDELVDFILKNHITYVVWTNDNFYGRPVASYFEDFKRVDSGKGSFLPLARFGASWMKANVYTFEHARAR